MTAVREGTAAVILAAGASTRLGYPKQLVLLDGEPLLVHAARLAAAAGCRPIVVVLGANHESIAAIAQAHASWPADRVQLIVNEDWPEGMAASIRHGVNRLGPAEKVTGTLILTCDQPLITSAHLVALSHDGGICATAYAGRQGVPAYFPRAEFDMLSTLHGDSGARSLLRVARAILFEDAAIDVDQAADVEALGARSAP